MATTVQSAPRVTEDAAVRIAADLYGLSVTAEPLPSERDQNFLLCTSATEKYVLKIANSEESRAMLDLQNRAIELLAGEFPAGRSQGLEFTRIVRDRSGQEIPTVQLPDGRTHFVRLFTWIPGRCLAEVQPHTRSLLESLGRAVANIDSALAGFDHPATHREFHWDLRRADLARQTIKLLPESRRSLVEGFFAEWDRIPWNELRFSVIHNDANDYNVLVNSSGSVNAILDYGDMVYSATVCGLAVSLAYAMLGKSDPIAAAAQVVAAYNQVNPLSEAEIDCLYTLVVTRLCMSVCIAAYQTSEVPSNDYLNISNAPAWELLERLSATSSEWARQVFRFACGVPILPLSRAPSVSREKLLEARRERLGPSLSLSYGSPLHIVAGSRQYLYASDGRRYLDCVNNVAHVGHSNPYVSRAAGEQMARLNTNTRYLHELLVEYAERLTALLPEPLSVVYLVNSGSEANELALRMARAHTGRDEFIVIDAAYHGNTNALIDISPYKFGGPGGRGKPSHVHIASMPDVFRGPHRDADAAKRYAAQVTEIAQRSRPAGFIAESALSCGGQIILPPGYLKDAYAGVRATGGVCIADEVQTGFGRPGSRFWMFETQEVVPDIVTMGKPIGNGHPLGAVVTTPEIARSFANGMEYFNTFGGNPVSCAIGLAVLNVIRDEELQEQAFEVGNHLMSGLRRLQERHALIGDVRGSGLFIGMELVRDRNTLEPADTEAKELVEHMKDRGVLLSIDGPLHNVIKIKPPLMFSNDNADFLVEQLDSVLSR